ncbi:MAG: DUF6351 family protein [Dehalococcoidia bacterium]
MAVLLVAPTAAATRETAAEHGDRLAISILSSAPDMVTGGDALVRVDVPGGVPLSRVRVFRNGADVTGVFRPEVGAHALAGLVDGFALGANTLAAAPSGNGEGRAARLAVTNYPIEGPVFSGPHQEPFVCKTEQSGLGQPLVDSHDGVGYRVYEVVGGVKTSTVAGWSKNCSIETRIDYLYRSTNGQFKPLPPGPTKPADLAQTTLLDGRTVDYIVRQERGTIDRFLYRIAMLAPFGEDPNGPPDHSSWNGRLVYQFEGGVAIGHQQGELRTRPEGRDGIFDGGLSLGYAVVYSTGTRTGVHYNLQLGGETALMVKERFIERHGVPYYTVGVGGSGGGIQQYVYGQNHPGLLDAAVPQYSYPDMVTQTIHVSDCELIEHYMDVTDGANPKWKVWTNRSLIEGMNASNTVFNPYRRHPGSTECIKGWRGLSPLTINPHYGEAGSGSELMDPPGVMATVKWTYWDDLRNIYGVDADGYARRTVDNVGVQYGLKALDDGQITPAEFLKLNANIGGWKKPQEMVQEGCPFINYPACLANPASWDPWSSRNMNLSPDGGVTPAPRTQGDISAMNAAYRSGLVFDGRITIPIIDWRHYLENDLNMHNTQQSFSARQRMIDGQGTAENQVIWFTDARPDGPKFDQTPEAFRVIDDWMRNIKANPSKTVAENKPPLAVDRCFTTAGVQIAAGEHVWDGILDNRPAGACTKDFPIYSTSRRVAGGPITGNVFKCALQSVDDAIEEGLYGAWVPTPAQKARLQAIFPTGVCDYSKPDQGRPGRDYGDPDDGRLGR